MIYESITISITIIIIFIIIIIIVSIIIIDHVGYKTWFGGESISYYSSSIVYPYLSDLKR